MSKADNKLLEDIKQMLKYTLDVDDIDTINGYADTFVDIAKEYHVSKIHGTYLDYMIKLIGVYQDAFTSILDSMDKIDDGVEGEADRDWETL